MDERMSRTLKVGNITVTIITVLLMLILANFMTGMIANVGSILTSIGGELPPLTRAVMAFTDFNGFRISSIILSGVLIWIQFRDGFGFASLFANQIAFMLSFLFSAITIAISAFVPLFSIIGRLSQN